ncbi:8941_t:CDS:2 [Funneliformis caledonium]|uniref:8941_t:CDS:1 n=1 Tax=Funneliformis caledonium TaxID=1117310 RepID=A0A9N9B4S6_9GLOM|nr:8941_t:CDS:2 [Funneliformis caledonium]
MPQDPDFKVSPSISVKLVGPNDEDKVPALQIFPLNSDINIEWSSEGINDDSTVFIQVHYIFPTIPKETYVPLLKVPKISKLNENSIKLSLESELFETEKFYLVTVTLEGDEDVVGSSDPFEMKSLKLLIALAVLFIQITPNLAYEGVLSIPSDLSWIVCSEERTNTIGFEISEVNNDQVDQNNTLTVGWMVQGVVNASRYITHSVGFSVFVLRKKNLELFTNREAFEKNGEMFDYYSDFSCEARAVTECNRHTVDRKLLPDYDYQCLIVVNPNFQPVAIQYIINFDYIGFLENSANGLSGEVVQILQVLLIFFIVIIM